MKTLYIECNMGAAGDMLSAALLELIEDKETMLTRLNSLGIPGVTFEAETALRCGITGTRMIVKVDGVEEESTDVGHHHHEHDHDDHDHDHVHDEHEHEHVHGHHHHDHGHDHEDHDHHSHEHHEHTHEHDYHEHSHDHDHDHHEHTHDHDHDHTHAHAHSHHHSSMADIRHWTSHLAVSDKVKEDILAVYKLIAEAESLAHNKPVSEIHFHEVGTLDALADISAVCLMMEELGPDQVLVSPIHVGSGQVRCAHGILPVPAPATATILKDVPIYGGSVQGELCTPTGAALLKHFADKFTGMPVMTTEKIGYGMGKKEFESANCVRILLGETVSTEKQLPSDAMDEVIELQCNIDDMTGEEIGYAIELLLFEGAREAFASAVTMKKSRPGVLLTVICDIKDKDRIVRAVFRHTTTIGIREKHCHRYVLERRIEEVETPFGPVRKKISEGYGVHREKIEHDDLSAIARDHKMGLTEVRNLIK